VHVAEECSAAGVHGVVVRERNVQPAVNAAGCLVPVGLVNGLDKVPGCQELAAVTDVEGEHLAAGQRRVDVNGERHLAPLQVFAARMDVGLR